MYLQKGLSSAFYLNFKDIITVKICLTIRLKQIKFETRLKSVKIAFSSKVVD